MIISGPKTDLLSMPITTLLMDQQLSVEQVERRAPRPKTLRSNSVGHSGLFRAVDANLRDLQL